MIPQDLKKNKAGGRPSAHSLLLTEAEFEWLDLQMKKRFLLIGVSKASPKVKAAIESVHDKMAIPLPATLPLEGLVLKLTRDELQVVNMIVSNTVKSLRDRVIPEYKARMATSPRLVDALELLATLQALETKGARIYEQGSHRRGNKVGK